MHDVPPEPQEDVRPRELPVPGVVGPPVRVTVVQDSEDVLLGVVRVHDSQIDLESGVADPEVGVVPYGLQRRGDVLDDGGHALRRPSAVGLSEASVVLGEPEELLHAADSAAGCGR